MITNKVIWGDFTQSNIRQYCKESAADKINQKVGKIIKNIDLVNYTQNDNGVLVKKGQELGMFKLGSTVVMIFESDKPLKWNIEEGQKVRFG